MSKLTRSLKQTSFTKDLFTDIGNIPLVAANSCGLALVIGFGSRKLFYHPDISVAEVNRNCPELQNEAPVRYEDAYTFRNQTASFASSIEKYGVPFARLFLGKDQSNKWELSWTKTQAEQLVPLERTNYFDDELYSDVQPSQISLSEDNYHHHRDALV